MNTSRAGVRPMRSPLRVAVIGVLLAVAGCFTAAFAFADQPAVAAVEAPR